MPFVHIYPDEHLYSAILRHWYCSGLMLQRRRRRYELSGVPFHSFKAKAPLNEDINQVIKRYQFAEPDELQLRLKHTGLPLQLLGGEYDDLFDFVENNSGYHLYEARINSDHRWRLCLSCFHEERKRIGVAYWHASHQLPSLMYCPVHHEKLHSHESLSILEYQLPHHVISIVEPILENHDWERPWQAFISQVYQKMKANPQWINEALAEIKSLTAHWVKPENYGRTRHIHDLRREIELDAGLDFNLLTDLTPTTAHDVFRMFWEPEKLLGPKTSPAAVLLGLFWKRHQLTCLEA